MRSTLIVIGVFSLALAACATMPTSQEANDAVLVLREYGSWAWALGIVLTRSLPFSLPEAMVFLAGFAGMPIRKFAAALAIGGVPTAFAFAAIGAGWADQPILALLVSYVLPVLLLPIVLYLMRPRG